MKKFVVSQRGQKINMAALKAANPNATPVGKLKKKKSLAKTQTAIPAAQPAKIRATVPSNKPVTVPAPPENSVANKPVSRKPKEK